MRRALSSAPQYTGSRRRDCVMATVPLVVE